MFLISPFHTTFIMDEMERGGLGGEQLGCVGVGSFRGH